MENKFQSSFVPKRPVTISTGITPAKPAKKQLSLFSIISVLVFLLVLAAAIAFFFYEGVLVRQNEAKAESLKQAVSAFDSELTGRLTALKQRMDSADILLNKHLIISSFFNLLESITVRNVRFTDFQYNAPEGQKITVAMKGEARSYGSLAYQSQVFLENGLIQTPMFSDLNLDDKGNVIFTFRASVDPRVVSYKDNIAPAPAPAQTTIATSSPSLPEIPSSGGESAGQGGSATSAEEN